MVVVIVKRGLGRDTRSLSDQKTQRLTQHQRSVPVRVMMPIDASFKIYVSSTRLMWNPDMATKRNLETKYNYRLSHTPVDFKFSYSRFQVRFKPIIVWLN